MSTDLAFTPLTYSPLRAAVTGVGSRDRARAQFAGYAAGYAAGRDQAEAEIAERLAEARAARENMVAAMSAAISALQQATARLEATALPTLESADAALASAVIDLSEAILGAELADGHASARATLARALDAAPLDELVAVRMSPSDLEVLGDDLPRDIRFVADSTLAPGDAMVDLTAGYLDARISSAAARARTALLGGLT